MLSGGPLTFDLQDRLAAWTTCSDGVTVDLTPPRAAAVLLGPVGAEGSAYLALGSELAVRWGHFVDVEEEVGCCTGMTACLTDRGLRHTTRASPAMQWRWARTRAGRMRWAAAALAMLAPLYSGTFR